jgi:4-hydroxy-4-methyl-2-oxoglutarate aldolase
MSLGREDTIRRFEVLASATVYDVLDKMGYSNQALSAEIRPLTRGYHLAGVAFTVRGSSAASYDGRRGSAMSYEMFRSIRGGDVIVFDTGGHRLGGPWGANTGTNAKARGAAGIVLDGGTRDVRDLIDLGFPTYCRFSTPVLAHGRFQVEDFEVPISVSGQVQERVQVNPGDFVLGDDDGVVIIPEPLVEDVLKYSEAATTAEAEIRKALEGGEDREDVDRRIDRWAQLKKRAD